MIIYNKKRNIKVCLCVIGKKENLYALEYVNHYKNLNYDHIFIYDNNDINDERFEDILYKYISNNFITIINYRGYKYPQFKAYQNCYKKNSRFYDWISFFDFDEFLELKDRNQNIKDFLGSKKFSKCINVKINGLIYSDNELLYYEKKSLKERFTKPFTNYFINSNIKSTVRGNLKVNYWENMNNPHSSYNDFTSCSPSGKIIDSKSFFNFPPDYKYALLKHYTTKTIEEYCIKLKKGKADQIFDLNYKALNQSFNYFFKINKKTKEKLNYIKNIFNISLE